MAQKINSTVLRLKKRLNWSTVFCAHNFNEYSNLIKNTLQISATNNRIMHKININSNYNILIKNSKTYQQNYPILNKKVFFYFVKLIFFSNKTLQNYYDYKKIYVQFYKVLFKRFFLYQKQLVLKIANEARRFNNSFLIIHPKLLAEFLKMQMTSPNIINLKKNNFDKNIQVNLLNFIRIILTKFKYDILGLKITCNGRWKKTKSGRKQKIYLKFGQLKNSNLTNKVFFHSIYQQTKYGFFSIKIWVYHKTKR